MANSEAQNIVAKFNGRSNPEGQYLDSIGPVEPSDQDWGEAVTVYTCCDGSRFADDGATVEAVDDDGNPV